MPRARLLGLLPLFLLCAPGPARAASLDLDAWLKKPGVRLLAVEFYATWCEPCMEAVPRWAELHDKYERDGLRLVVVATRDPKGGCFNPGWNPDDVICDDDGRLADRFGASKSLPAAFLWSWQGKLLANHAHVDGVERAVRDYFVKAPRIDVEVEGVAAEARTSTKELEALVRAELGRTHKVQVVASAVEKERLRDLVRRSLAAGADEKLACEAGQEVSANSLLKARVTSSAGKPRLSVQLFSAERGCLDASTVVSWNAASPATSVAEAVAELLGKLRRETQLPWAARASRVEEVKPPPPLGSDYAALLAEAERAEKEAAAKPAAAQVAERERRSRLEKDWSDVSKIAASTGLAHARRAEAVERFLQTFDFNNPHADAARALLRDLRAGKDPGAVAGDTVRVPGGEFFMGCNERVDTECYEDEKPSRRVNVPSFRIDTTEVTVAAFGKCVDAGACVAPATGGNCNWGQSSRADHPINCVDWSQAEAFCRWSKKRLPTEAEWEKAARGTDGRKYTWGNEGFGSRKVANIADRNTTFEWALKTHDDGHAETSPAGAFPAGASPYGALDMIGNVWEWTADWYEAGKTRSIRGGSWGDGPRNARASARPRYAPGYRYANIGFRCAQSE